jgi:DNA-directed RNA polymerase I, II, and III subunit RPABC1
MDVHKVITHIREMLEVRGEDVSYIEEHADAVDTPRFFTEPIELSTDKTTVFFALTKEVFKEFMKNFKGIDAEQMIERYAAKSFIIVVTEMPSPASMSLLTVRDKALGQSEGMLQVFQMKELMYNPTKHELVPKHEKMTEQDAKKMMEEYNIKSKSQLPVIHKTDVMARWLGLRHGDIVKITRFNETSGQYFYYRCCM